MAEGAKVAAGLGADIIDINMGCPAQAHEWLAGDHLGDHHRRPRRMCDSAKRQIRYA